MSMDKIHMQHPVVQNFIASRGERMVFCQGRFYQWRVKNILSEADNDPYRVLVQRNFIEQLEIHYDALELQRGLLPEHSRQVLMALVTAIQLARRQWEEEIAIN